MDRNSALIYRASVTFFPEENTLKPPENITAFHVKILNYRINYDIIQFQIEVFDPFFIAIC